MGSHGHNLGNLTKEIPKANTKHIWKTFWILSAITAVEFLIAGIKGPMHLPHGLVVIAFVLLTLVKAALIVAEFMHLGHEVKALIYSIVLPFVFICWLILALMYEGNAIFNALHH